VIQEAKPTGETEDTESKTAPEISLNEPEIQPKEPKEKPQKKDPALQPVSYPFQTILLFETASCVVPKNKAEVAIARDMVLKKLEYYTTIRDALATHKQ